MAGKHESTNSSPPLMAFFSIYKSELKATREIWNYIFDMGGLPNSRPSFFKIMLGDFTTKLRIPPAFRKEIEGMMSENIILKSNQHPGRSSWLVNMVKVKKNYFLGNGWMEFAKDHLLETGDFLLFFLLDHFEFHVNVFDKTCCPKKLTISENISIDQKSKKKPRVSVENNEPAERSPRVKVESDSKEEEFEIAPCDKTEAGHPHFMAILKKYNKYLLNIPKGFAAGTRIAQKKKVNLKDPEGRPWPVNVHEGSRKVDFGVGWSAFFIGNKLVEGDKCLFQFVGDNVINVHIFRKGCEYGRGATN